MNNTLDLRLTRIGQAHLSHGLIRWKTILVEVISQDGAIVDLLHSQECQTIFDKPKDKWAKADWSRYPWYEWEKGEWIQVVSEATIERLEKELGLF